MAGAGYKLFNTGDVLTAAQVNTYLNEQTVMVFADSAARTTALSGVLAEGMMSYLQDTDSVEVYDGTSWTAVGGGSSPLTTKGDLYTFSTVDARLAVGANGTVLTADSAETTGLKWAAASSPSFVGCSVYKTTNQSINNTSETAISWDAEIVDTNGFHDNVTNNTRFTVPSGYAGKYLFVISVVSGSNSATDQHINLMVNGATRKTEMFASPSASPRRSMLASMLFDLGVGDYLTVNTYQNSGGSVNILSGNTTAQRSQADFIYLGA